MQVTCPRCGSAIPGVDIDLASRSSVCRPCGEIVPLPSADGVGGPHAAPRGLAPLALETAAAAPFRPTDLSWDERTDTPSCFQVQVTPARAPAVVMLLIAIFWDGFLLVWFGSVMSAKHPPLMLLLFPLIHVAIGVFITYQAVCGLVNRIHVRLDGEAFEFKRGPVPQRGDVREPTANIAAFEVLEQRAATTPSARRSNRPTFGIRALTQDSRAIPVRFGFTDATHAEYAAQRFSQMLAEVKQRSTYRG